MTDRTELTELEKGIARKYSGASFPPATAAKAFARNLELGHTTHLSSKRPRVPGLLCAKIPPAIQTDGR